jgi:hypothetical protein
VLTLKFGLGLFDDAYVAEPEADRVRLPEDAALARRPRRRVRDGLPLNRRLDGQPATPLFRFGAGLMP